MANFNRVILLGNVTRDIELKYLQSGTAVTEMGLAVHDRRKNQQTGEWVEEPVFVDVTLWGRTAEIASEYLSKGSPVLIEGKLKFDTWEKDGQKRSKLRVVGETLQLLGSRNGGQRTASASNPDDSEGHGHAAMEPAGAARATAAPVTATAAGVAGPDRPPDDIPF